MQYQKPGYIMKLASADFDNGKAGTNYLLQMRAESNRWLLQHLSATPKHQQIVEANEYLLKASGLWLADIQLSEILALFPLVRIELAVYGIERNDVQDNLKDAISNFFLGCTWPRHSDNVNIEKYISLLRHQAVAMGYQVTGEQMQQNLGHPSLTFA